MKLLRMINLPSSPGQAIRSLGTAPRRDSISLRKTDGRTTLFETTMMSFHSSTRWSRRASHIALAALLFAAVSDWATAQDVKATSAAVPPAATGPATIASTNTSTTVKPAEASLPARVESSVAIPATDTNTPVLVKSSITPATARTNSVTALLSMDSFKLIADRNIFNQSRVPGRRSQSTESRGPSRPPSRVEAFALVGTMIYEKGNFAFFDGSGSQYRKTVKAGDSLGAYKLTEVGPNQVKLTGTNQEWALKVGQELRRENEGEWKLGVRSGMIANTESASSGTNSSADSSSATSEPSGSDPEPVANAGPISDVLRRMMEARAKEDGR